MEKFETQQKIFSNWKKQALTKLDKSPKGYIDEKIEELCNTINKHQDFFTLSSCSGRVCLLEIGLENKKTSNWIKVEHNLAKTDEFYNKLKDYNGKNKIFFRQESVIIHIALRKIEDAKLLMDIAKRCGFNQVGIISLRKIVVELICDKMISTKVYDKKTLIDKNYLDILIKDANQNQKDSWKCISSLEDTFKKTFKTSN